MRLYLKLEHCNCLFLGFVLFCFPNRRSYQIREEVSYFFRIKFLVITLIFLGKIKLFGMAWVLKVLEQKPRLKRVIWKLCPQKLWTAFYVALRNMLFSSTEILLWIICWICICLLMEVWQQFLHIPIHNISLYMYVFMYKNYYSFVLTDFCLHKTSQNWSCAIKWVCSHSSSKKFYNWVSSEELEVYLFTQYICPLYTKKCVIKNIKRGYNLISQRP